MFQFNEKTTITFLPYCVEGRTLEGGTREYVFSLSWYEEIVLIDLQPSASRLSFIVDVLENELKADKIDLFEVKTGNRIYFTVSNHDRFVQNFLNHPKFVERTTSRL